MEEKKKREIKMRKKRRELRTDETGKGALTGKVFI